jgi:glycosyltransferase involved in cell wall biosynthesis
MILSIITINLNNDVGLERTIKSVISQQNKNFEYIIIDGGSKDNSLKILNKYSKDITLIVSEKDNGIYNAMNKGIKLSNGEYLLFLNSGDELYSNDIVDKFYEFSPKSDIIYGSLQYLKNTTQILVYPKSLTFPYILKYSLPHPSSFIKKELLLKTNGYNENDKITSDWQFFIESIFKLNSTYSRVDFIVSKFYSDGVSNNPNNLKLIENEKKTFFNSIFPNYDYNMFNNSLKYEEILMSINSSRIMKLIFKVGFLKKIHKQISKL